MEEGDGEEKRDHEQNRKNLLIRGTRYRQPDKTHQQNYEFRRYYVGQYGADEEAFLTFEKRSTARTVMPDVKRLLYD